jgi:hypothetical protein
VLAMIAANLIDSGSVQFIIFGLVVIAIFVLLFITIAR